MFIFAQYIDVLALRIRRYLKLPTFSYLVPNAKEIISREDMYNSLGALIVPSLSVSHTFSIYLSTGSLSGKCKLTYRKAFCATSTDILLTLSLLETQDCISNKVMASLEYFTCQSYQPKTNL